MGALYCDNQPISDIKSLRYTEMKYWNKWHDAIQEAWSRAGTRNGGKKNA
jgi:hypothetical protein